MVAITIFISICNLQPPAGSCPLFLWLLDLELRQLDLYLFQHPGFGVFSVSWFCLLGRLGQPEVSAKKWLDVKLYNHGQWFYIIPHPFLGVSSVYRMMFAHWGNCRLRRVQSERPAITIIWAHNPLPSSSNDRISYSDLKVFVVQLQIPLDFRLVWVVPISSN